MRSRPALLILLVVLLLVVGGGAAAWALFLRGDEVAPLALPSRAPTASSGAASSSGTATASGATTSLPPASAVAIDAASIPGSWAIAADSVVGYRVREKLASLSAESDAVGRTNSITGSATIASSGGSVSVTAAEFSVDMTSLASDRQMRDNRLRSDGIQTDSFPTSTFKLSTPVAIAADALAGGQVDVTLHGDLTLHGVTKTVDIPAKAQINGSLIQVLGTLAFPFSDYGINAPNIGGFVSVQDQGTLEFQVNLAKA
jgi:polyisoprenoid-binding protein YceI